LSAKYTNIPICELKLPNGTKQQG